MKKLTLRESSCLNISPEIVMVWLIDSDKELPAAKSNWFAVNRIISGRRFTGCLLSSRSDKVAFLEKLTH